MHLPLILQSVALVGGTVHTMNDGQEPSVQTVLIEEGRITAIGADLELPEGTERIDVTGMHVVPGLIDGMVNHDSGHDALYVASGVTFVRETGSDLTRLLSERKLEARNRVPGPELFVSGVVDGDAPASTEAVVVHSAEEAAAKVPCVLEKGVDYVSVHDGIPADAWRKTIEIAHGAGLEVWGQLPAAVKLEDAIAAGQDGFFTLQALLPADRTWGDVEPAQLEPAIAALARSGTAVTPALSIFARLLVDREAVPAELELLDPRYAAPWLEELDTWRARITGETRELAERSLANQRKVLRALFDAGVPLVPGSGTPNPWLMPGRSLVDELEEWARAGIPAADVLRLATAGAADAIGVGAERGRLAVGQVADMLVLGSDPRESLAALHELELVVVRGTVLEPEDIEALLDGLPAALAGQAEEPVHQSSVALVGGTVHTMTDGTEPSVQTVLIENGRIEAIGAELEVPEGTEAVDVTGMHVVPGLIDGMVNHDADHDALYVASGVTFIRDTGNDLARILAERTPEARNRIPGPDLFIPGLVIDGDPPATTQAVIVRSAEEAQAKIPRLLEHEVDYLSVHNGIPADAWRKTIEIAHEAGLQVWGPLPAAVKLEDAINAGQDGFFTLQALIPADVNWGEVELAELEPAIAALARSGIAVTPALSIFARLLVERDDVPAELELLGPHYEAGWRGELGAWRTRLTGETRELAERSLVTQRKIVRALFEAGVPLVPGTGAPNPWLMPGRSLIEELEEWVRAGIPAADVLRLATAGAADVMGVGEERGRIAVGQVADMLVLGSDPRQSLTALRRPELVVVRGMVLEPEQIDDLLDTLRAVQNERREELNRPIVVAAPELPEGDKVLEGRAETRAAGNRISAEHYAVVRMFDGRIAYCTRMLTMGSATRPATEVQLVQRVKDGRLESFETKIQSGGRELSVKGILIGGLMNVERRLDGVFVDNNRAKEPIALIDIGSVTAPLLLAQHFPEGDSYVVYFENVDPVVSRWKLVVSKEDGKLLLQTAEGRMICEMEANGVPAFSIRRTGNSFSELTVYDTQTFGGPGLPLPPERVYRPEDDAARQAVEPTEAGAPGESGAANDGDKPGDGEKSGG